MMAHLSEFCLIAELRVAGDGSICLHGSSSGNHLSPGLLMFSRLPCVNQIEHQLYRAYRMHHIQVKSKRLF
jgi:hypothetical protein